MSQLATPFHILLIEADPTDARFFSNLLTQVKGFRFEVDVADSLTAASACLAQNGVDGVLLDPCLPGTAPKQAISAVLEQAVDVPVVVLVNPEMHELGVWAIVEGARDYLIKGEDDAQTVARSLRYAIQRQCAERALEASATRYRKLVEMSPDAVILTGPDMRILFANQRAIDMYGFDDLSQMIGLPVAELFALEEPMRSLVQDIPDLHDGRLSNAEFMFRRRDGECFPGELSISVLRDGDGELQGTIGIVRDVTERKRAEAAERQQRVFAEALYNAAAALNSTLDLDQVLDRILENVEPVVPHDGANIMLLEDGVVRVKRCRGYYDQHDFVDHLLALEGQLSEFYYLQEMARTRRPVVVSDVPGSPHWATNQPKNWMRSYVGAPITREGELMG
ncbi:MAG TPA: PAS domain S-box protein, partial [Aggregatilineales bacterium]|nr:PAS domain S-box protein [Aggregatilineales bacterium]